MHENTSYEIAASHTDGRRYLIGYSERHSLRGIFAASQGFCKRVDASAQPRPHYAVEDWTIGFTGRTLKDARREGKLSCLSTIRDATQPTAPADPYFPMTLFPETSCSQCGRSLGPGYSGLSHCIDHRGPDWRERRDAQTRRVAASLRESAAAMEG